MRAIHSDVRNILHLPQTCPKTLFILRNIHSMDKLILQFYLRKISQVKFEIVSLRLTETHIT